jgi:rhamnosyl/mannosyltransferase
MPDPMAAMAYWIVRPECRLVVHWHSDVVRQRLAYRVYAPLQDWLLARADAIVATSPPYAEHSEPLARWRDKVTVVPIGISDNRSENSARAQALRARFGGRRLVFALGRMTYYKGFDVLIEAAAALPADCAVMIGGDGELLSHFDAVIRRRGLANRVYLLGHVPDHDLNAYFEACDVFCMPSTARSEAYGVAIVEAMVMGKPIVATDLRGSGVPWVNRHMETGLNVPVGDPAALAAGLSQLLDDEPLRRRLGAAARRRYESDFGAERMTSLTLDLYRRLVPPPTA